MQRKIIKLEQNTPEWLEFRMDKIGASDANIIMGVSKFMKPEELLEKKQNPTDKPKENLNNYIQQLGHKTEDRMINYINLETDSNFEPVVMQLEGTPYMASMDGYDAEKNITWEHKLVGAVDFDYVSDGAVLPHYNPQVQLQLYVTGAEYCIFHVTKFEKGLKPVDNVYTKVYPDPYYTEIMLKKLSEFHGKMINMQDFHQDDEKIRHLLSLYRIELGILESAKEKTEMLKAKIFDLTPRDKYVCSGAKITQSVTEDKQVPDYKKYCESMEIDMQDYMKTQKGRTTRRITFGDK